MDKLGINPAYLITQIVNFTILVLVLAKLVYKPILDVLEKRKKKIEEGLALTEKLTKEKEELDLKKTRIISETNKEAKAIIDKARDQGKKVQEEIIKEARISASEIIERGKKDIEVRKKEMEAKLVGETINMAASLTEKLIMEVMDSKKQDSLFKKRLNQFLRQKN